MFSYINWVRVSCSNFAYKYQHRSIIILWKILIFFIRKWLPLAWRNTDNIGNGDEKICCLHVKIEVVDFFCQVVIIIVLFYCDEYGFEIKALLVLTKVVVVVEVLSGDNSAVKRRVFSVLLTVGNWYFPPNPIDKMKICVVKQ